jgi:hypothetical protein
MGMAHIQQIIELIHFVKERRELKEVILIRCDGMGGISPFILEVLKKTPEIHHTARFINKDTNSKKPLQVFFSQKNFGVSLK